VFYICTSLFDICLTYYVKLLQERYKPQRGFFQLDHDSERVNILDPRILVKKISEQILELNIYLLSELIRVVILISCEDRENLVNN